MAMHVTATQGILIYVLPKQYNKTIILLDSMDKCGITFILY